MNRIGKILSDLIPQDRIFPLVTAVIVNFAVYFGTRAIAGDWYHHNIEGPWDELIPLWAPSVLIYFGCYLFWIANYIIIARQDRQLVCRFFSADFISRMVCMVIYLVYPTTNTRPVIEGEGFWDQLVLFLYNLDAADNLFPSIHCLVSWFCYIGLRGRKSIPFWYRTASCVMAVLVCISTLTTRQHVIIDVIGGVALAEICFLIGKIPAVGETYEKFWNKVNGILVRKEGN